MFGNRSEWTRSERLRAVLEGRRHLGQQVIEAIFISSEPFSAADAESHLRDLRSRCGQYCAKPTKAPPA